MKQQSTRKTVPNKRQAASTNQQSLQVKSGILTKDTITTKGGKGDEEKNKRLNI